MTDEVETPSVDEQIATEATQGPVEHALTWLEAEAVELFGDVKAVIAWIAAKL